MKTLNLTTIIIYRIKTAFRMKDIGRIKTNTMKTIMIKIHITPKIAIKTNKADINITQISKPIIGICRIRIEKMKMVINMGIISLREIIKTLKM